LITSFPIWAVFLATTLVVLLAIEVGYRRGRVVQSRSEADREKEAPVGAMVSAALGLLALLLAFTFGMAEDSFQARRVALQQEANAIRHTYLRAQMLAEPHRTEVRNILRAYVDDRLKWAEVGTRGVMPSSAALLDRLWAQTVAVGDQGMGLDIVASFVDSVSEIIRLNEERWLLRERSRIPLAFGAVVFLIAILTFAAMGYHAGVAGTIRSPAMVAVAVVFSLVIMLIVDLNRPGQGFINISQEPMAELRNSMAASRP
jgi:protein-S-isoprenylcysteine O-methyltransferase Ste14